MPRTIVGIDIGTAAITTVIARAERGGKFRIIGVGSAPSAGIRRGVIVDPQAAAAALLRSSREAGRAANTTVKSAVVAVGGAHLNAFPVRGAVVISRADGEITEDDVRRAVNVAEGLIPKNPNREVIHLIPRTFRVDGEGGITDPVGMVGMKLDVEAIVVDGSKAALQNIIRTCEAAGITIEDWVASTLAAADVLLSPQQRELGAVLLDLGAGTSDLAIFEEGRLVDAGSFPIGGGHITADIAIGLRVQPVTAEAIKVRYAQAVADARAGRRETIRLADFTGAGQEEVSVRDLTTIVSARLSDIFELTTKALKRIGRAGLLPGGAVLTGGVTDIPGIQVLARRELKLPVEVAKAVGVDMFTDVVPPRLAVPVGLIVWQLRNREAALGRWQWGGWLERFKRVLNSFVP